MIINIRGTSGSGKSTLIRAIRDHCAPDNLKVYEEGRRQPVGYILSKYRPSGPCLFIPGHYETACGGCDTISKMDDVFGYIRRYADEMDIVFEGIMVSGEWQRTAALHEDYPGRLNIVTLQVPMEECKRSILERRAARGDQREIDLTRTIRRQGEVNRMCERLKLKHIPVHEVTREQALPLCLSLLGLGPASAGGA